MGPGLQTINYHQGLISFNIPDHWCYGFDPARNEAVFYQEREGSGLLRLHYAHIVRYDSSQKPLAQYAAELAENGDVSVREDGAFVCTRTEQYTEEDKHMLFFHWFNLKPVDGEYVRMAHLSYTTPFEELYLPDFEHQLAIISRELTMLAWAEAESLYDSLRTVLAPVQSLNESIVQYPISEQVAMAIASSSHGDEYVDFVPYSDLEAWCIPPDEAWRRAFENMDRVLAETPITVEELVDGIPMAFFDTESPLQAGLITAPSLRAHVESSIGWPVQALLPCQDFLHLIPAHWSPSAPQIQALSELVIDEWQNSPCALSTELFMIDDHGIHASGRFEMNGFVQLESNGHNMDAIEEIVESAYPNPLHPHEFYNRGLIYSTMLQHERAIASFTRAIELDPGIADYYRSRAVEYELMGEMEKANQDSTYASHLS